MRKPQLQYSSVPEKNLCAMSPASGGKKKVTVRRIRVNLHPSIPTSIGSLATPKIDQPAMNSVYGLTH